MANQDQLDLLKQGVGVWNQWREENPSVKLSLQGADLYSRNLSGANLREADLSYAQLRGINLNGADLSEANLEGTIITFAILPHHPEGVRMSTFNRVNFSRADLGHTHFDFADLREANLRNADLRDANFDDVNLSDADLSNANLGNAKLTTVELNGADFAEARLNRTSFGDIDLSVIKGLDTVKHIGPSTIGIDTIYRSKGNIPEVFLKGAGVDDTFITYIRSLVGRAIEYYSCFISYSSKDEAFAKRLYADLQSNNVRCWFAPEDLKWGERIRTGIDEAIRLHDKLLLILSKSSVASGWVEHEVKTAMAKERKEKRTVLFPVRLDKAVLDSPLSWATEIRHVLNDDHFCRWRQLSTSKNTCCFFAETMAQTSQIMQAKPRQESLRP